LTISDERGLNSQELNPQDRKQPDLKQWLAAGLGSGWLPKAPGTWGSLAALLPAWLILDQSGAGALLVASVVVWIVGCAVCAALLPQLADQDPGWIVIDEWAGQWLCLALLAPLLGDGWLACAVAFAAFRLFDIAKPWPISWAETAGPPWWSIMADDIAAGLISAALVWTALSLFGFGGFL